MFVEVIFEIKKQSFPMLMILFDVCCQNIDTERNILKKIVHRVLLMVAGEIRELSSLINPRNKIQEIREHV